MAESILFQVAGTILENLCSLALKEIGQAWGVESELNNLETTLTTIRAVLLDAEEQQVKNHSVRDWLNKLRDALYDVEDILDDFTTEALRRKLVRTSKRKQVSNLFSHSNPLVFRITMGHEIKKIREKMDRIAADRTKFEFRERGRDSHQAGSRVLREQSHSFVSSSDVIGRSHDKERIIELILSSSNHEKISVIPIVGLGGLGKTTLAKLVYNDDRVVSHFDRRMWVCVSEDFDLKKLSEKIIKSASSANCAHLDMDQLQVQLRACLNSKRYLLVLDDVWNDDPKKWEDLRSLLSGGAKGSKIVVTTRSTKVAAIMGTVTPYSLRVLSDAKCMSIFVKCAFREGEEKRHPRLVEIGRAIVNKCGGVPLAIKTLGSLLYGRTEEAEWRYIKDHGIWEIEQHQNDILPILKLSYDQMPSYLKPCFAYCSIFPKDYQIPREELINLWIAQGFIQSEDQGRELEDIGNRYFNELLSRSFFEDVNESFDCEILTCKMHDLIHDLALSVASVEFSVVKSNTRMVSERVRHVLYSEDDLSGKELPPSLLKLAKLRSFSFSFKVGHINNSFVDMLARKFKCLRVLDLSESEFKELPDSIGNLKHLRYLGLCENRSITELPNSICKLLRLQTLYLLGCERLQGLPKDVGRLGCLRHLYLTSQLTCLPQEGLEGLTSLRSLSLSRCERLQSLSEGIGHLTSLRVFHLTSCPMLASLPSSMKKLTALEKLWIWDCQNLDLSEGECMEGLTSLQSVVLWGLPKLRILPEQLQGAAATLQYLHIQDCSLLERLPEWLQSLKSLLKLEISNCQNLRCLPDGIHLLTSLQVLCIIGCPQISRYRSYIRDKRLHSLIAHIPKIYVDGDDYHLFCNPISDGTPFSFDPRTTEVAPSFNPRTTDEIAPWVPWADYKWVPAAFYSSKYS